MNEEQYDEDIFEDDEEEGDLTYFRSTTQGKRGRRLIDGGPPRPDTSGMTDEAAKMTLQQWRVNRKAHTDKQERLRRKEMRSGGQLGTNHTGILSSCLRIMTDVESLPFLVNHTFPTRELLNLHIAKEANLYGCNITVKRSDNFMLAVAGSKDSLFHVNASCSSSSGWKVNQCYTRHATLSARSTEQNVENSEGRVEGGEEDGDMDKEAEDSDDIEDGGEDGDADGLLKEGDADGFLKRKHKTHKPRTPIKARWLLPFIHNKMADMPNMSNGETKNLLADYVKAKFLTGLLLQNARKIARDEIFGDPSNNVFYTRGLVAKMEEAGMMSC